MTFDNGTWWLVVLLLGFATGALIYLLKRSLFGRVDRLDESVKRLDESTVKKADDIERIKQDYTPRRVHDKDHDATQAEIKKITENYLTKEDFFREQAKTERKLDTILDILMKQGGRGA